MMVRLVSCYRYEIRDIKLPIRIQDAMQMQVRIRDIKLPISSVVDPDLDPHGSGTFAWIRIRNSENSKLDPDPE